MKECALVILVALLAVTAFADCGAASGCCSRCGLPEVQRHTTGTYSYWMVIRRCEEVPQGVTGGTGCEGDSQVFLSEPTYEDVASVQCAFESENSCTSYQPPDCEPNCGQDNGDNCGGQCSPIVLNLGNGTFHFSGADDPVLFDLDIDGKPDRLTWTARGSEVAFLAIDHGLDGVIASGAELFGNRPGYFANGFETLKVYDSNHDDLIDHNDSVWPFLRLWTDVSHDGISQAGELQTLDSAGVQGLSLAYHETARADRNGNEFRQQAIYWRNGQARPYYDVWLARVP